MSEENHDNNERSLHAGDDQGFEQIWWRVEVGIWVFLCLLILIATTGLLGRGPLSKGVAQSDDGKLVVEYERIGRYKTPSSMKVQISPEEFKDGVASLWVNNAIVNQMGLQRVVPEPERAEPGPNGVTYTWLISSAANIFVVRIDLQPDKPGIFQQEIEVPGKRIGVRSVTFP